MNKDENLSEQEICQGKFAVKINLCIHLNIENLTFA